jgi:hypothetical protein
VIRFNDSYYFATPGLFLRLSEGRVAVYVRFITKDKVKAWLVGQQEPEICFPTYGVAVSRVLGDSTSGPSRKYISSTMFVFTSIMNHFIVGTPLVTSDKFVITAEGERLRPPVTKSAASQVYESDDENELASQAKLSMMDVLG